MSSSRPFTATENIPLLFRKRSRANSDAGIYRPFHLKHRMLISTALLHTRTLPEVGQLINICSCLNHCNAMSG
jgi:hypothetical protein